MTTDTDRIVRLTERVNDLIDWMHELEEGFNRLNIVMEKLIQHTHIVFDKEIRDWKGGVVS